MKDKQIIVAMGILSLFLVYFLWQIGTDIYSYRNIIRSEIINMVKQEALK